MIKEKDFNLSTREISEILPIEHINTDLFYPLAKASLFGLKKAFEKKIIKKLKPYEEFSILEQIPDFNENKIKEIMKDRSTSIEGLI